MENPGEEKVLAHSRLASAWREERNRDATADSSTTETDDCGPVQRGPFVGISEDQPLAIARPVDSKQIFAFEEQAESKLQDQKTAAVAINLAELIRYLRENGLLDHPEKYDESINSFFNQKVETLELLDADHKADIKTQQAAIMANDLESKGEDVLFPSSLVRLNTLSLIERSLDNTATRIKSHSENHAALLKALQEVARSASSSLRRAPTATAQEDKFSMEAVRENKHASTEESIVSQPSITNAEITHAKIVLEQNRLDLEQLASNGSFQEEARDLQEIMKKRHDDFLFQEAFSNQHAQLQAEDNAAFCSAKLEDIQRSIQTDHEAWLSKEDQETGNQVKLFRESLGKVASLLENIREAYGKLSSAYADKVSNGADGTEERNILSQFDSSDIAIDDERVIVGQYGVVTLLDTVKEQNLLGIRPQIYKDGMNLVRIAVMKNFGISAVKRFDETFHVSSSYLVPLTAGEVKIFIVAEHKLAATTNHSPPKSYFFSSIDSLSKLERLAETEKGKLIRSNGHQLHFNPFSGEEPSLQHVTDDEETAWEGALAVRESLKEEDFFKRARALQQRDILNRYDKKFLGDQKDPLTIQACNAFVRAEREKSQEWKNQLYYRCFSNSHEINQALWSWFSAIVSGERAQQPFTDVSHPIRSLTIAVVSAYSINALNDVTRPYRKPAKDDGVQSARAKEAVLTPNRAVAALESRNKIEAKSQDDINKIAKSRKEVVVERLQKYTDPLVDAKIRESAQKIIVDINSITDGDISSNEAQQKIDRAFQFLVDYSSQLVAKEREHLESIHQKLDLLSQQDFSQNKLCSSAEVETMQRLFEETKASFLLQQARFHENIPDLDQLQQIAAKNAALFSDKAKAFERKVGGGRRTVLKVGDKAEAATIQSQLDPLAQLHVVAQEAREAYDQLSKIYSLRIARPFEPREGEMAPSNLTDQLLELEKLGAEGYRKIVVSRNGKLELIDPQLVDDFSETALKQDDFSDTALKQDGISLVKLALFDAFGKEGVTKFNNSFQFKTSGKKSLALQDLKKLLASKFENRSLSYFLSLGHSVEDLLRTAESENKKVIRSNGRTFVYNPFSPKDASQEYLLSNEATAQEGVASICASLAELDFFKKATKLNQYDILKRFCQQFQGKMAKSLTVEAFKAFVQEEKSNSQTWSHYLYYKAYDPWTLSQEWAGIMSFVTGARFQHPFTDWNVPEKFALTWVIDILGEYTGQYREYRDGGIYHKLVEAALNDIHGSSARSAIIPNFEERLKEALKKKEAQQSNANVYQYVVASQEYDQSVQKILADRTSWVTEQLQKRSASLAEGDLKETFTKKLDKINTSDEHSLEQRVSEGIDLLTQDSDAATAAAMSQLTGVQEAVRSFVSDDQLSQNVLFSKKDLNALQQTLTEQLANLGIEQIRSHQSPLEIAKFHANAARNADFFFKKIGEMEAKLDGGYEEITEQGQDEERMMKQLSIFNKLRKELKTAAQAYDQLADAISLKMMAERKESPQERENFISRLRSQVLPAWGKIVVGKNGHLAVDANLNIFMGLKPSDQDRLLSAAALPLLKSEIADAFGEEALRRFESQIKVKMIANHPLTVGDVQQLIESESNHHNNLSAFYLSAGHSLEQVLHAASLENGRLLRSHGSQFRYNPFAEAQQKKSYITGDEKTAQEGVNASLKALREMEWFKKLTRLNQEYVVTHFEERFKTPKRTWVQFLRSFIFEEQKKKPEDLTVGAFKSFVQSEIQASEEWKNTYQLCDNPLFASTAWNIVAGAGVIARIDPRVINCTPIHIAFHYGGHCYLVHTITALTILPHALHAVPSILIAYGINRVAESWLHLRQRPVPSPIQ